MGSGESIMGIQVRKRTKGKTSWTNASYSNKGLHASHTTRIGKGTLNISSRGVRSTYNFGNGVKYVTNTPWKKKEKKIITSKVNENNLTIEEIRSLIKERIETLKQEEQNQKEQNVIKEVMPVIETIEEVVKAPKKKLKVPTKAIQKEYTYKKPIKFFGIIKKLFIWYTWISTALITLTILSSFFGN
jgi:molecular chaperone DnaK (HSP70)